MSLQLSNINFLEIEMHDYTSQKIRPSPSNTEFDVVLEKTKKKSKRKSNKTQKNISSKPNRQRVEGSEEKAKESKPKTSSELKDPWD